MTATWTTDPVMIRSPAYSRSPIAPSRRAAAPIRSMTSAAVGPDASNRPLTISRPWIPAAGRVGWNGPKVATRWNTLAATTDTGLCGGRVRSTISRPTPDAGDHLRGVGGLVRIQVPAEFECHLGVGVQVGVAADVAGDAGFQQRGRGQMPDGHLIPDAFAVPDTKLPTHTLGPLAQGRAAGWSMSGATG
jgi:hypothetical protein